MPKRSAWLLMYRGRAGKLEVFLVHPLAAVAADLFVLPSIIAKALGRAPGWRGQDFSDICYGRRRQTGSTG